MDTVDVINDAITNEPAPEIAPPTDLSVTLLKGLEIGGEWYTDAQVREMTGEDEEALYVYESQDDLPYSDYVTQILLRTVESIGTLTPTKEMLDSLILADRDILFLASIRATYGNSRTVRAGCPHCGASNDIVIELGEDFPIKKPTFDITKPIEVHGKKSLYFRIPSGADTAAAAAAKSDAEANTLILSKCAVFPFGGEPDDRLTWARKLNSGDRRKAIEALLSIELGPSLEAVETHCAQCQDDLVVALNWVALLLG